MNIKRGREVPLNFMTALFYLVLNVGKPKKQNIYSAERVVPDASKYVLYAGRALKNTTLQYMLQ